MGYNENLKCQALSKREVSKLKPKKKAILISIQDGEKYELPFKQRTNHVTRSLYEDVLFVYFDDIDLVRLNVNIKTPFLFSCVEASKILNFLDRNFKSEDKFEQVIVHCQAGISRSQAVVNFISKYYFNDKELLDEVKSRAVLPDGNLHVYNTLEECFKKRCRNYHGW